MDDLTILGVDCGATKLMAQSVIFDQNTKMVIPDSFHIELSYSDHPNWNSGFIPVHLDLQRQEFSKGNICLSETETNQGNVIIETIQQVINRSGTESIGFCIPGIKNDHGIVIMANGPRIPDLLGSISGIDSLYHDSDCCVWGEWKSSNGKLEKCDNAVYIGGGTGIADGIILKGVLVDFNQRNDVKRSWELFMPDGHSVEFCLSPKGMIDQWNSSQNKDVSSLSQLIQDENAIPIIEKAVEAFSFLIQDRVKFFKRNHSEIDKIVIGQRLGQFLSQNDSSFKSMIESSGNIPIEYSSDRRTAALGAAWKKACS